MAFQFFGLVLWSFVAIIGAWLLITGRSVFFGFPIGAREGWPMRAFGLIYIVAGSFLAYRAFEGSFSPEGIVFSYVGMGLVVWSARHKARTVGHSQPGP